MQIVCKNIWNALQCGGAVSNRERLPFSIGFSLRLYLFFIFNLLLSVSESFASSGQALAVSTIIIDSYTEWNTDEEIGANDILIVNDTLIVFGNLIFRTGAELYINEGAVCIVYGDLELNNKVNLSIGAHLIVGGNLSATSNADKIDVQIDSTAAVYILGDVDTTKISGMSCPMTEVYVPHTGSTECNFGDIISLEDNENDSTGIYDLFVGGNADKGVTPVYSELCEGGTVPISALFETAAWYQWCDSIGNEIVGETGYLFNVSEPGEYFVKIYANDSTAIPDTSYPAKVVAASALAIADITSNNSQICPGEDAEFYLTGTAGATVFYSINGVYQGDIVLTSGVATLTFSGATVDQTLTLDSIITESCNQALVGISETVSVYDGIAPVFTSTDIRSTIQFANTPGICGWIVDAPTLPQPTATDNCSSVTVRRSSQDTSWVTFPAGITPIGFEARDESGNSTIDTIFIEVVDTEFPVIDTCPMEVFSTVYDTSVHIYSLMEPLIAKDNCLGASLTITLDTATLSSEETKNIEVVASDASSNSVTCDFNLTISDDSPIVKNPDQDIVCEGATIEYSFAGAWPGNSKWSVQGPDATIDDKDAQTTDITFNAPGVYSIRAKIQDTGKPTFYNDWMVVVAGDPNSNPVSVSINANPSNSVCTGTEVTFTATPTNGGISPSYQWQLNGADVGSDQNSYINSGLIDGDKITCILTSSEVCSSNNPDTSAVITMDVNDIPTATLSGDATICSEQSTNLTVTLTGSGPWNLSYSNGSNSYNEDGITGSPHSIEVSPIINTSYSLISVSNVACAGTTSGSATISVESTPVAGTLTKTPGVNAVCDGDNVSAILTAGSGGNGTDELDYSIDGGSNWSSYISGTNISTTGLNEVQIRTRRMANHCTPTAYETVNWIINSNSEITLDQSSTKICFGDNEAVFGYTSVAGSPDKYNIDFDTDAETAGFVDVVNANLTGGSITVTVPLSASPDTYNAVLTVNNSATGCTSVNYSISIVINPLPATGEIIPD